MVVSQGLRVTFIGLVCGLAGAYASTRLLQSLLFEVSTTDTTTFIVVPVVFVVVTVLASVIPAVRAARIDPVGALRV
jgi:ABC-type lipoprotein release transport system permease subunit